LKRGVKLQFKTSSTELSQAMSIDAFLQTLNKRMYFPPIHVYTPEHIENPDPALDILDRNLGATY